MSTSSESSASLDEVRRSVIDAASSRMPPPVRFTTNDYLRLWESLPAQIAPPQGKFRGHMLYPRDYRGKGPLYYGFRLLEYAGRLTGLFHWYGKIFVDNISLALPYRVLRVFLVNFHYFDAVLHTDTSVIDGKDCTLMTYKKTPVVDEIRAINDDHHFGIIYTHRQNTMMFLTYWLRPQRRRDTLWTFFSLHRDGEDFTERRR